jgi:hypothetical protein
MTKESKKMKTEQSPAAEGSSCMDMMAKMMGQSGEGVSCESIISQIMSEDDIPEDWQQEMSKMTGSMSSCCGSPAETTKE